MRFNLTPVFSTTCTSTRQALPAGCAQAGSAGDTPSGLLGIQAALLDPQPQVLAVSGQRDVQDFIDLEVFSRGLEHSSAQRFTVGPRAKQI